MDDVHRDVQVPREAWMPGVAVPSNRTCNSILAAYPAAPGQLRLRNWQKRWWQGTEIDFFPVLFLPGRGNRADRPGPADKMKLYYGLCELIPFNPGLR